MKQLSRDPSSRTRFLKAEARANEKSGGGVSSITIKPIGGPAGSAGKGGGGFKKGGFKAAFGSAGADEGGRDGDAKSEIKGEGEIVMGGLGGKGEGDAPQIDSGEKSNDEEEGDWDGEGMYDPKQPTGCWAGCPGLLTA